MPYGEMLNGGMFRKADAENADVTVAVKRFFEEYRFFLKSLEMSRYEREYFGDCKGDEGASLGDEVLLRAKMYEIKRFILSMPGSYERLFLYYHYIRGESVEKCAELLDISRRSAFRLKKKALLHAAEIFENM